MILPHVHLDVGYTDFQAKVLELHARNIDRAITALDHRPDYRFMSDGHLALREFVSTRRPAQVALAATAMRAGKISANAFPFSFLTGLVTAEEVFRACYDTLALTRDLGGTFDYANLTDVPSYSAALPSLLSAVGIDSFLGIANHTRASNRAADELHLASPFLWEGPDGSEVMAFYADHYVQLPRLGGDPPTVSGLEDGLVRFLERFERPDYPLEVVPVVGTRADNEDVDDRDIDLVESWNAVYAWPTLRWATPAEYFASVRPQADRLRRFRGDGGSYWEDGVGSAAAVIGAYRRAQMALPTAEALVGLTAFRSPNLQPSRRALDEAWRDLLLGAEHTWTYAHATDFPEAEQTRDQLAWKEERITRAARTARDETLRGFSQLGELVTTNGPTVFVFNPSSWSRTDIVEIELPPNVALATADGSPMLVDRAEGADGMQAVRFAAEDVPALGYRSYGVVPDPYRDGSGEEPLVTVEGVFGPHRRRAASSAPADVETAVRSAAAASEDILTERYRIRVDSQGRIIGLEHRATGWELLDEERGLGLGEVIRTAGPGTESGRGRGEERSSLTDTFWFLPEARPRLQHMDSELGDISRTAGGWRILTEGRLEGLESCRLEVRIHDDRDRVDVSLEMEKLRTLQKEALYVAFPFRIPAPRVRFDRQLGWIDPSVDHLPGACNEWFTTMNAVTMHGSDHGVTWSSIDAPLFVFDDVVRGTWPEECRPQSGTLLSWIMNNYWFTNTPPTQWGRSEFRYAFEPVRNWDPARAFRFGSEVRSPLVAGVTSWLDKRDVGSRLLPPSGRLLTWSGPRGVIASAGGSRVDGALLVRLTEVAGEPSVAVLVHPAGAAGDAVLCDALERTVDKLDVAGDGSVAVSVPAYGVRSILLSRPDGRTP